jgi:NRPS condensation-like uncharacterized protein
MTTEPRVPLADLPADDLRGRASDYRAMAAAAGDKFAHHALLRLAVRFEKLADKSQAYVEERFPVDIRS